MEIKKLLFLFLLIVLNVASSVSNTCTPLITSGLVAYYPFCSNANDESGNGNNGNVNGASLTSDRFGNTNSAYSFNGTTSYIFINPISALTSSTYQQITISFWMKSNSFSITNSDLFDLRSIDNSEQGVLVNNPSQGNLQGNNYNAPNIGGASCWSSQNYDLNQWYHVVFECDYSTNTIYLFLNGTLVAQNTGAVGGLTNPKLNIGSRCDVYNTRNQYFNGVIDDFGVWNRALSPAEITALYSTTSTSSINNNLISYWKLDGNSNDSYGTNNGTNTAITFSSSNGKIRQGAGFNGTSSYIQLPSQVLNIENNWTVSAWFKTSNAGNLLGIFDRGNAYETSQFRCDIESGRLQFLMRNGSNQFLQGTTNVGNGNWHFGIWQHTGGGRINIYLDGFLEATGIINNLSNLTYNDVIGRLGNSNNYFFNGSLDEIGVWSRSLSGTEISNLYNNGNGIQYPFNPSIPIISSVTFTNVIENNSGLQRDCVLYSGSAYVTDNPFKICADGSTATYFKITLPDTNGISGIGFRILNVNNQPINDTAKYGKLGTSYVFGGNNVEVPYTHPQYLDSGLFRSLKLQVLYRGDSIFGINFLLQIFRAPVLLVHGWKGNIGTFEAMEDSLLHLEKKYVWALTHRTVYPNSASFNDNMNAVPNGISDLFNKARSQNFSCGKADIICHSMGGILARLYLQSNKYGFRNDMHKLITLNTPHSGTQGANFIYDLSIGLSVVGLGCQAINWIQNHAFYCSPAVENMRVNSYSIRHQLNGDSLNFHTIPSFAITTEDPFGLDPDCYSFGLLLYSSANGILDYALIQSIFNFEKNDVVVPKSSQRGGLVKSQHFFNQCHPGSPSSPSVISFVKELLDDVPDSNNFAIDGFHPDTLHSIFLRHPSASQSNQLLTGNLTITNPVNASTYSSGDQIIIQTTGTSNIQKTVIAIGNNSIPTFSKDTLASSTSTSYTIPYETSGEIRIICLGYDTVNGFIALDTVSIKVIVNSSLDSIGIYSNILRIPLGNQASLGITGYYHDGIARDISEDDSIVYLLNDTSIAKHINQNIFQGTSVGTTLLTVLYKNKSVIIPIEVYQGENNLTTVTLDLKVFIEGFYQGNGLMAAVVDPINNPTLCDTITVELHSAIVPYDLTYRANGPINTNGIGAFIFTSVTSGFYYVVVKSRNALETWSKNPVLFNLLKMDYDFTSP